MSQDTSSNVGRRERRKLQTRRALLDSAMALFAERGVYATRLEDITEKADLGKGAFYNYFESKDALVAELISEGVQKVGNHMQGLNREAPFKERVALIAQAHERFFDAHPEQVVLFHQARGLLKLKTQGTSRLRQAFGQYLEVMAAGLWGTEPVPASTHAQRLDIVTALVGALTGYRSFRIAVSEPVNAETLLGMLTSGLPDDATVKAATRAPSA